MKKAYLKLKTLFTGKPHFQVKIEHPIKEAFISGGVQYYMFDDVFNIPMNRSYEAQTFYTELQMRVDREYLEKHVVTMDAILSDKHGINVGDIGILNAQLKERMDFIVDSDLLYKLASVMYFDTNENPYQYDFAYGSKKIAKWKNEREVSDFFLNTPIKDFIPFIHILENDLESYLRVTEQVKNQHQKTISNQLSKRKKKIGS